VNISFAPIPVKIESQGLELCPTRLILKAPDTYPGRWTFSGGFERMKNLTTGNLETSTNIKVYGIENSDFKAKWTISYGSVSFSDSILFKFGYYSEYEALEDLELSRESPGGRYKLEDGHVVELNLGSDDRAIFITMNYPSLKALKYLKRLDLRGNLFQIKSIPEVITSYYKDLSYLNLSGDYLTQIPAAIGNLSKLDTLILNNQQGNNEITSLPDSFCNLTSLKYFDISSNNISELPENFGNLNKLETLKLWGSVLNRIPVSFGNLSSLKYCYISGINSNLPESFSQLTNLVGLNINGDPNVTKIPDNIGNLKKLKSFVYQGDNNFERLPESICNMDSLNELVLRSGSLKELPTNIGNLKNLQKLDLYSSLSGLPPSFPDLSNLKYLLLKSPESISHSFHLPEEIGKLSNIEGISIWFVKLDSVPNSIGNLSKLIDLDMNYCNLQSVPPSIGNLKKLNHLSLIFNKLSSIPDNFKNLKIHGYLNLNGNENLAWQINEIRSWNICTDLIY
jgi:Leucine-rich repeat (LRR) protein